MSRKVLGLDIRLSSVSAVLLENNTFKGAWKPVAPDASGPQDALEAIIDDLQPTGAACVLGISTHPMSFRHLTLPFRDPKKIRQVLPFELESNLPVPMEELSFDFEAAKGEDHHNLLVFMAPKEEIQRATDMAQALKLRPVIITPAAYAGARCMITTDTDLDGDGFFIDTDGDHHAIYVICKGKIRSVRTILASRVPETNLFQLKTGLDRIRISVQDGLGLDFNPAWIVSGGPDGKWLGPDQPEAARILKMPVRSMAAIRAFPRLTGETNTPDWKTGKLDTALALALMEAKGIGGINFSTERAFFQHYWTEHRSSILFSAALFAVMLIILLTTQVIAVSGKERRVAELDRQIETIFRNTLPDVTHVVNPVHQMKVKLQEVGTETGTDFPGNATRVIDILNAISQEIPGSVNVVITRLVMGADNVVLTGDTDTFNMVNDIKGSLEKASVFKAVTISSADLEKGGQHVRFRLKLDF